MMADTKPDLDTPEHIADFIDAFYARLLRDPQLGPIFLDVAQIDLDKHLPLIRAYWRKLILGEKGYHRHTMNIHRDLHAKRALRREDFERWLGLFCDTLEQRFEGPCAQRARDTAQHIATNMHNAVNPDGRVSAIEPHPPV